MAADTTLLQGQIIDEKTIHEKDVEGLLRGFVKALAAEISVESSILQPLLSNEETDFETAVAK